MHFEVWMLWGLLLISADGPASRALWTPEAWNFRSTLLTFDHV